MYRRVILRAVRNPRFWRFLRQANEYRRLNRNDAFAITVRDLRPLLGEANEGAGIADPQYFFQDLWAARLIYERRPSSHLDIGSRIDGFVAHLLTFMDVTVVDVRPLQNEVNGMTFIQSDATELAEIADSSVNSLSCLHAVEHFGLGRYGDPIDPDACFRAMRAMARVLAPGGRLYLSMPIGRQRVEFNGQRVFDPATVLETCELRLISFAAVDDQGQFWSKAEPGAFSDAECSCGLFEFTKD